MATVTKEKENTTQRRIKGIIDFHWKIMNRVENGKIERNERKDTKKRIKLFILFSLEERMH